jgi:uncharacterized protein YraI
MTLTAAQYSQIAQGYEKAAADPWVAAEKRVELLDKAEWFRFLAERGNQADPEDNTPPATAAFEGRARSMSPFLATLWITGAAVYLFGTLLFTNAVNFFGTEKPNTSVPEIGRSVESVPKVASVEAKNDDQAKAQHTVNPERRHAISPGQPTYESPTLTTPESPTAPPAALPQEELASTASSEPVQEIGGDEFAEVFIVTAAASIRNGPSTSAKKIGTATTGAEIQVKQREKNWVHFVDPSSGNAGWIQASLLKKPAPTSEAKTLAASVEHASVKPARAKLTKAKLAKKKPSVPAKAAQQPRTYVDLPPDEEFLPPRRRGAGFLSRRRMLRHGLMSTGFLPPE